MREPQSSRFWKVSSRPHGEQTLTKTDYDNYSSPKLGNGNCLILDSTNAAWLQYPTIQNGTNRFSIPTGSLMFWFASSWSSTNEGGTGPGDWGRLVEIGAYTTNASYGWLSLFLDPS